MDAGEEKSPDLESRFHDEATSSLLSNRITDEEQRLNNGKEAGIFKALLCNNIMSEVKEELKDGRISEDDNVRADQALLSNPSAHEAKPLDEKKESGFDKALLSNGIMDEVQLLEVAKDAEFNKALLSNGLPNENQNAEVPESPTESGRFAALLRLHWPLLVLLWLTHVCIGMANALPGSSMLQLARQVGASVSALGFWFTAKSAAACVLALLTGFQFNRLPERSRLARPAFLTTGNLLSAGAMLGASLARSCALALCLAGLLGAGHGALETANGILVIRLFGSLQSRTILHSLHFCTALGGLIAPLLLHPFLARPASVNATAWQEQPDEDSGSCSVNRSTLLRNDTSTIPTTTMSVSPAAAPMLLIAPYSVLFALQAAVSVGLLLLAIRQRPMTVELRSSTPPSTPSTLELDSTLNHWPLSVCRRRALVALTVIFYFTAVGGENIFWSFASAYAACAPALRLDARGAAALHAAFFAGFLIGRGLGVVISRWAQPTGIMLAHLACCLAALLALCLSEAVWLTFAGTAAFGLAVSVLYATGVTWLEQRLPVAGPVACSWLIGGQLGVSTLPAFAGHLLLSPSAGPAAVMQLALGAFAAAAVTFLCMLAMSGDCERWRRRVCQWRPACSGGIPAASDDASEGAETEALE